MSPKSIEMMQTPFETPRMTMMCQSFENRPQTFKRTNFKFHFGGFKCVIMQVYV